ncbi:MAG: 50S ribosomal protein L13 [Candidatus Yanofskybacteria bacterium GW2011_GWD2_39_48]|uniref:50S ribosomal protein L13 n=1 Tax=Candidatus Yanofskybacteria bacterium GW2011_GWD2_39_48 TaxID=1619031 RepID=A0A0G0PEG7_9BACT|nr:MAG: 50S ribosomal protein L13 [Candidatus Yanofskybacteria bacterium GW2011_GWD2_39_48]
MIKHEINAENMSMGRVASQATHYLRGKHLPSFNPRILPQVEVTISNISKIKFTGQKYAKKVFYHYSGYHGGLKTRKLSELWEKEPKEVVRYCVYRMLPKNKSRDKIIRHLRIN